MLTIENPINGFLGFSGGADDQTLVVSQSLQPVLNVRYIIAEAVGSLDAAVADEGRSSEFGDQLFLAVCFRSKENSFAQAIQAIAVTCAVRQLMEGCAVILGSIFKLRE